MYRLIDCITQEHHYGLVAVAAFICVVGSVLSVHMTSRLRQWSGKRRLVQLPLASLITGATIWSTHFIAMLAYEPGFEHGYEPVLTGVSLLVGIGGAFAANAGFAFARGAMAPLLSGAIFGMTVAASITPGCAPICCRGSLSGPTARLRFRCCWGSGLAR
jgi:diguanylate cyclase